MTFSFIGIRKTTNFSYVQLWFLLLILQMLLCSILNIKRNVKLVRKQWINILECYVSFGE